MKIEDLLDEVAKTDKCSVEEVEWYSWPQTFPTTGGPKGAGGNIPSTFQVYAFDTPAKRLKYCGGIWRRWDGVFQSNW